MAAGELRFYQLVPGAGNASKDYTVPAGKFLNLLEVGCNASPDIVDSYVAIVWDPAGANETILAGYSDSVNTCYLQFAGDGAKVMRISMTNNEILSRYMGGYFLGTIS